MISSLSRFWASSRNVPVLGLRVFGRGLRYFKTSRVFFASSAPGNFGSSDRAAFSSAAASFPLPFFASTIPWWYRMEGLFFDFPAASAISG